MATALCGAHRRKNRKTGHFVCHNGGKLIAFPNSIRPSSGLGGREMWGPDMFFLFERIPEGLLDFADFCSFRAVLFWILKRIERLFANRKSFQLRPICSFEFSLATGVFPPVCVVLIPTLLLSTACSVCLFLFIGLPCHEVHALRDGGFRHPGKLHSKAHVPFITARTTLRFSLFSHRIVKH